MRIKHIEHSATEECTTPEDRQLGSELAHVIGDTHLDSDTDTPLRQWIVIVKILRVHGLKVTEAA